MPTWSKYLVSVVIAVMAAAVHFGVGPLGTLSHAASVAVVIAAAAGLAGVWGLAGALVVGVIAAALLSGVHAVDVGQALLAVDASVPTAAIAGAALPLFVGTIVTLLRRQRTRRAAADLAQLDPLTGLFNRVALEAHLAAWIARGRETGQSTKFAVLVIDLDRFKVINDMYGHDFGDLVLTAIARLLREHVRGDDLVARLGGDEFVVAMPGLPDRFTAGAVARKFVALLSAPIYAGGKTLAVSASIGIAVYPYDGEDVATLMTGADSAMYTVKSKGKNSFVFSDPKLRERQVRRLEVEQRLRIAVADHRLRVAYQPQIDLSTGKVVAFEALLRWEDSELGTVSPGEFVPIAEEAGLIVPIGIWLIRETCYEARAWDEVGDSQVGIAVNVSSLQFRQKDFVEQVEAALHDSGLAPERLEIEVTEGLLIDQLDVAMQALRQLQRLGVRTALDDFGTGYSSLAYLQRLPIHALKIDRSFISCLALTSAGRAGLEVPLVDAITAMGRTLGKTVVAEGVETAEQARYLQRIGVHHAQGFYFGKPMSSVEALHVVQRQRQTELHAALAAERRAPAALPAGLAVEKVVRLYD